MLRATSTVPYGDGPEYWDMRYKADPEPFEWLRSYAELRSWIQDASGNNTSASILHLGCGNSLLPEDMYDDGYHNIINVDNSEVVISQMMERNFKRPQMLWLQMDALDLSLPDNAFDLVLDKSLIDTFACSDVENIMIYLMQVSRVLRESGVFLVISYGTPDTRLEFLTLKHLRFEVQVVDLPPNETSKVHYLYICKKVAPQKRHSNAAAAQ
ncbi:EEF1AKNMT [Symbiodinium pilosum]|uniref:EEF1AKNMT protein n=1 Tax=Symbiodinium pilosum TaxID=2952 RepID=A0A812UBZ4_SYMPI|nr:EEF1AKNMT [Symbiodinium pilosum]